MEIAIVIFFVGLLVFLAHLFSALFERIRIPDVLPLVFIGLLIGPILGFVTTDAFGKVGNVFTIIALILILFEGGLYLNFSTLRESMLSGTRLTIINFVGTVVVIMLISISIFDISVLEGLILGAILGGTSSVIVIPLVNKLRLQNGSKTALLLESTFSDVLCIVVTLAFIQAFKYHELRWGFMFGQIIASFFLAGIIGALFAFLWSSTLNRVRQLENSIFLTPAFVFIIFGITELLGYSGAISALTFGITLGNIQSLQISILKKLDYFHPIKLNETEKAFFAEVAFLIKTFFFVYIGLSIRLSNIIIILAGVGLTLVIFAIRIPIVRLAMNKTVTRFDASIASVIVPKGLAAAVLAYLPLEAGVGSGIFIQDVVYSVIIFSIIATAILTFLIDKNILHWPYLSVFSEYATEKSA